MKAQTCIFKRTITSMYETGIAILNCGFGTGDVKVIIDSDGKPVPKSKCWTYELKDGPMCYLDTEYIYKGF